MTDDQFSKAFKQIVPDSPSPEGWASGALRKRRNRAGIVGGTVGVLAVALAIPMTVSLSGTQLTADPELDSAATGQPNPADHAPEESDGGSQPVPDGLPGAAACFGEDGERVQPATEDVELERGAVRAWLCGDASGSNPSGTIGPLDPLETGVDRVVEFVEAQPELDLATISCTMEYSLSYLVVLEYPDGSLAPIAAETHGCQTITVGQTARSGGVEFLDHLTGMWTSQRDFMSQPDYVEVEPPCPVPNTMLVPSVEFVVAGTVCVGDPETGQYGRSDLAPEDVERIVADIRANAVEGEPTGWDATLALVGSWGDWLRLVASEDGSSFWFADADGTGWVWTPSPEVAELLAAAAEHPDMPSQPGTKEPEMPVNPNPTQVLFEPDGCVGVHAGELTSSELPDGVVPAEPSAVWLCGKGLDPGSAPAGPLEPLEGDAAQSAVDLYNALEVPEPNMPCTEELGPSYFVVHEYSDGTRLPVEIQDYGCRVVAAGAELRGGGGDYLDGLVGLWAEQREATGAMAERPAPICSAMPAIMPVGLADVLSAGYACRNLYDDGQGDERAEEALAPELLQSVIELAGASSYPLPDDAPYVVPTNDAVVLLNQFGDPLALTRMEDGTYQWLDGPQPMAWEPPSAVAAQLEELLAG